MYTMNAPAIIQAIPLVIQAIKAIEAAIPQQGQGQAKLDAVLNIITAVNAELQQYLPQLTAIIGTLVSLFNKTGAFTK